jgi:hypothetical protein
MIEGLRFSTCMVLIGFVVGIIASPALAQDTAPKPKLPFSDSSTILPTRSVEQSAFSVGERLKMRVTYLGLTVGYIEVRVDRETIMDRDLYTLNMKARTSGTGSWFYTVRDRLVSYMDVRGLFSWGYDFYKNHPDENKTTRIRYHHAKGIFRENGKKEGTIPTYTQDLLSAIYYIRTQELDVGQRYSFPIHSSDHSYKLTIKVKSTDRVATMDEWRDAYLLVPSFEKKSDRDAALDQIKEIEGVKLWICKDKHKVPLKLSVPATFGQLYGFIVEYEPGNGE